MAAPPSSSSPSWCGELLRLGGLIFGALKSGLSGAVEIQKAQNRQIQQRVTFIRHRLPPNNDIKMQNKCIPNNGTRNPTHEKPIKQLNLGPKLLSEFYF